MADNTPSKDGRTDTSDTVDQTIVNSLDHHTVPLDTVDPMTDCNDLAAIHDLLTGPRIIGLGETTHGSRELFQLKHRLVRYLVSELGVRVFGLEANFSEALALNNYVVHDIGDPKKALEDIYFWTWNVESVLEMVEWLRTFNATRAVDDRVRFYGFDAQYSQGAIDELVEFFETVDAAFLTAVRDDLDSIADAGAPAHQDDKREARFETSERVVPELRDQLRENREPYIRKRSKAAWKLARQHVRIVKQANEYNRALHDLQEGNVDENTAVERCLRVRDRAMADNVDWILEYENADRMAIWAHDAHINRVEQTSRETGATATSLGGHLAARHGDEYYALGFSFGHGSFQAISEVPNTEGNGQTHSPQEQTIDAPLPDTIDATLAALDYPIAIVDIRTASEDTMIAEWLTNPQRHFSAGATYDPKNPEKYVTEYVYSEAFDGVCFIDETTRARPIGHD